MIRIASAFILAICCGVTAPAQGTIFIASNVDAVWADGATLCVQGDRRIHRFERPDSKGLPRALSADGIEIPPLASFFDLRDGKPLWLGARAWGEALADRDFLTKEAPLLRRPIAGPPIRLPMLLPAGGVIIPARPAFLCKWASGDGGVVPISVPMGGRLELGWGVGDPLEVDLVVPHLLPRRGSAGTGLVVGLDTRWTLCRPDVAPVSIGSPPSDDEEGILEFPFSVPPLTGDLDGDGDDDLVVIDPSAGTAALYLDLDANHPEPTRVVLLNGMCLGAWIGDFDGDGRPDLALLRARKPGLAGQLKVLTGGALGVEVLLYPGKEDGTLPNSPASRLKLDIGITIGIRNEVREAAFTSLCVPRTGGLLVIGPDGVARRRSYDGEVTEELGQLPAGRPLSPFAVTSVLGGCAVGWTTPTHGRVVWFSEK